jgi:hypothetical protein
MLIACLANGCTPGSGLMDSSDIGPGGTGWAGNCSQSGVIRRSM